MWLRENIQPDEESLLAEAGGRLARYKLPKVFVYVAAIERAPSGKPDYRWARRTAEEVLAAEDGPHRG